MNYVEIAKRSIKQHEGLRLKAYYDTVGKLTIGYGRNLDDVGISQSMANAMRVEDSKAGRASPATQVSSKPYEGDEHHWRIVYGGRDLMKHGITEAMANAMLIEDMLVSVDDALKWCNHHEEEKEEWQEEDAAWNFMNDVQQAVIVEMAFNMGITRFLKFNETRKYVRAHVGGFDSVPPIQRYVQAGFEMLDSRWAKQVGQRALTLARRMGTGEME